VGRRGGHRLRGRAGVFDVVVISELKDGKMWRDRWYFAEPFEAPEWRSLVGRADGPLASRLTRTSENSPSSRHLGEYD
jgi:hypothetical protein